jgi:sugar/nucleoside kinase (ribokinase family)
VFGEVPADFRAAFDRAALAGVSAQGWLRALDAGGYVVRHGWEGPPFWRGYQALFVSDEDMGGDDAPLATWAAEVPIVAVTESSRGARVRAAGAWQRMDAFPEEEADPTGAGDTFATAFLIRFHETGDPGLAARFGAAAASLSVRGTGADAIATRDEIEARMREHPQVALR